MSINWFSISRRKRQLLESLLGDGTFRVNFDHEAQSADHDPTTGKTLRVDRPLRHLRDVWKTCAPQHLSVSASKPRIKDRKKLCRKKRPTSAPGRRGDTSESSQEEASCMPPECSPDEAFLMGLDKKTLNRADLSDDRRRGMNRVSRYVRLVDEAFREMESFLKSPPVGEMAEVTTQIYNIGGDTDKLTEEDTENVDASKAYLASLIGLESSQVVADELIWETLATNVVRYHAFCRVKLKEFLMQPLKDTELRLEGLENSSRFEECGIQKAFQSASKLESRHKDSWLTLQNVVCAVKQVLDRENRKVHRKQEQQFQRNLANEVALGKLKFESPEINEVSEKLRHVISQVLTVQAKVLDDVNAMGRRLKKENDKLPSLGEDLTTVLRNTTSLSRELFELSGWVNEDSNMRQADNDMEAGESTRNMKQIDRGEEHLRLVLHQDKRRKGNREKVADDFEKSRKNVNALAAEWQVLRENEAEARRSLAKKKAAGERRLRTIQELCELSGLDAAAVEKATQILRPTEAEEPLPQSEDGLDIPPPPPPPQASPKPEEAGVEKRKVYTKDERLVQAHGQCLLTVTRREAHILRQKKRAEEGLSFKLDRIISKDVQREIAEKDELDRQKRNDMIKRINEAKESQLRSRERVQAARLCAKKELERWQLMLDIESLKTTLQNKHDEYEKNEKKKKVLETEVQQLNEVIAAATSACTSLKLGQFGVHPKTLKITSDPLDGKMPEECREEITGLVSSFLRTAVFLPANSIDSFLQQASEASTLMATSLSQQGLHGAEVSERLRKALGKLGQKHKANRSGSPGIAGTRQDKEVAVKSAWELSWLQACDGMGPRSSLLRRMGSSYLSCLDDVVERIGLLEPKRIDCLPRYYDGAVEFGQQLPLLERAAERMIKYWQEARTMRPNPASTSAVNYLGVGWRNTMVDVARKTCSALHALAHAIKATSALQKAAGQDWDEAIPAITQVSSNSSPSPVTRPASVVSAVHLEPELRAYARGCVLKRVYWALATWFNNLASVLEAMRHGVNLHNVLSTLVGYHTHAARKGQFSCREQTYTLTKTQVPKLLSVILGGVLDLTRLREELRDADLRPLTVINDLVDSVAASHGLTSARPPQSFYMKKSYCVIEGTLYSQFFAHEQKLNQQYTTVMELYLEGLGDLDKGHTSHDDIITDCCQGLSWLLRFWWLEVNLLFQVSNGARFQKWRAKMRAHFLKDAQDIRRSRTHKFPEELARFEGYKPKLPTAAQLEDWQTVISAERYAMTRRISYVQRTAMLWCLGEDIFLAPFEPVLLEDCRPKLFQDSIAGPPVCWGFTAITDLDLELRVLLGAFDRGRYYSFEDLVASFEALLHEKEEEDAQKIREEHGEIEEASLTPQLNEGSSPTSEIKAGDGSEEMDNDIPLSEIEKKSPDEISDLSELPTPAMSRAGSVNSRVSMRDSADVKRMRSPSGRRQSSMHRDSQPPAFIGQKQKKSMLANLTQLPTEKDQKVMDEHSAIILATHDESSMVEALKDEEHKLEDLVAEFKQMDPETQKSAKGLQILTQLKQSAFTLKNDLECVVADVADLDEDDGVESDESRVVHTPVTINVVESEVGATKTERPASEGNATTTHSHESDDPASLGVAKTSNTLSPQALETEQLGEGVEAVRSLKRKLTKRLTGRKMLQPIVVHDVEGSGNATPEPASPKLSLTGGLQELQELVGTTSGSLSQHEDLAETAGGISAILREVDNLLTHQEVNDEPTTGEAEERMIDSLEDLDQTEKSGSFGGTSTSLGGTRKTVIIEDIPQMTQVPQISREECEKLIDASSKAASAAKTAVEEMTKRMDRVNGQIAMAQETLICAYEGRPPYSSDPVERKHHVDELKSQLADHLKARAALAVQVLQAAEQATKHSDEAVSHAEILILIPTDGDMSQPQDKLLKLKKAANTLRSLPLAVSKNVLNAEVKMQQWCHEQSSLVEEAKAKNDKFYRALALAQEPLRQMQGNIGMVLVEMADTPEKRLQQLESQQAILDAETTIMETKICESEMTQSLEQRTELEKRLQQEELDPAERQKLESQVEELAKDVSTMGNKLAPLKVEMVAASSTSLREKFQLKEEVIAKKRASLLNAITGTESLNNAVIGGSVDPASPLPTLSQSLSNPPRPGSSGLALISPDVTALQFHRPANEELKEYTDKMVVREHAIANHIADSVSETARQVAQLTELAKVEEALKAAKTAQGEAEENDNEAMLANIQAARQDILENVQNLEKEQRQLAEDRVHALKAIAGSKHDRAVELQEKLEQLKLEQKLEPPSHATTPSGTRTGTARSEVSQQSHESSHSSLPELQEDVTERMKIRCELLELEAESETALREANVLVLNQLQSEADTAQELEKLLENSDGVEKEVLDQARDDAHVKKRAVIEGKMAQLSIQNQFISKKVEMAKQNETDLQQLAKAVAIQDQLEKLPEDAPSSPTSLASPKSQKAQPGRDKRKSILSEAVLRRSSLVGASMLPDSTRRQSVGLEVLDLLQGAEGTVDVSNVLELQKTELSELVNAQDTLVEESLVEEVNLCQHDLRHSERKAQDTSSEVRKHARQVSKFTAGQAPKGKEIHSVGKETHKNQHTKAGKQKKGAESDVLQQQPSTQESQAKEIDSEHFDLSEPIPFPTSKTNRSSALVRLKGVVRGFIRSSRDLGAIEHPLAKLEAAIDMTMHRAFKDQPAIFKDIVDEDVRKEARFAAQAALKAAKGADKVASIEALSHTMATQNAQISLEQHRLGMCERKIVELEQRMGDIQSGAIQNDSEDADLERMVGELQTIETQEEKMKLEAQAETLKHAIDELVMRNRLSEHKLSKMTGQKSSKAKTQLVQHVQGAPTPKAHAKAKAAPRHKNPLESIKGAGKGNDILVKRFLVTDDVVPDEAQGLPYSNFSSNKPKKVAHGASPTREKPAAKQPEPMVLNATPQRMHLKGGQMMRNKPKEVDTTAQPQHVASPTSAEVKKRSAPESAAPDEESAADSAESAHEEEERDHFEEDVPTESDLSSAFIRKVNAQYKLVDAEKKSIQRKRVTIAVLDDKLQELESNSASRELRQDLEGLLELEQRKLEEAEQLARENEKILELQQQPFFTIGWHTLGRWKGPDRQRFTWTALADKVNCDLLVYQCFEHWQQMAHGEISDSSDDGAPGRKKVSFQLPGFHHKRRRKKKAQGNYFDAKTRNLLGRKTFAMPQVHHEKAHTFIPAAQDQMQIGERLDLGRITGISLNRVGESLPQEQHAEEHKDQSARDSDEQRGQDEDEVVDDQQSLKRKNSKQSIFSVHDAEKRGWRFSEEALKTENKRRSSGPKPPQQELSNQEVAITGFSRDEARHDGIGVWPQSWQNDRDGARGGSRGTPRELLNDRDEVRGGSRGTPRERLGGPPSSAGSAVQNSERRSGIPTLPAVSPRSEMDSSGRDWFLEYASAVTAAKVRGDIMSSEGFRHSSPRYQSSRGEDLSLPPLVPNRPAELMVVPKVLGMDVVTALHSKPPEYFQDGRLFSESYVKRRLVDLAENRGQAPKATQWTEHGRVAQSASWHPIPKQQLESNTRRVIEESAESVELETGRTVAAPSEASALGSNTRGYLPQGTGNGYPLASPTALAATAFLRSPPQPHESSVSLARVSTAASLEDVSVAQVWKECLREVKPRKIEDAGVSGASSTGLESMVGMVQFSGSRRRGAPETADAPCNGMPRCLAAPLRSEAGETPRPAKAPRFLVSARQLQ